MYLSKKSYFNTDPLSTGIERPLWGPLYTLPDRNRSRYKTMHELPWCVDPLKEERKCQKMKSSSLVSPGANVGYDCGWERPYSRNKI